MIVQQIPTYLFDMLYLDFLYKDFLRVYSSVLNFPKEHKNSRYTWNDKQYRSYMLQLMHSLEPVRYSKDKVIYEELEAFNEVTFFMKGKFKIGFTLDYEQVFFPY